MDDTNNLDRFLERTGIDSAVRDTIRNSGLVSVLGYQTELDRGTLGVKLTKAAFARVKLGYEYLVHSKQDREDGDLKLTLTRVLAMDAKDAKSWEQWSLFQWHEKTSRAKGKRKRSSDDEQREDRPIDDFDIGLKLKLPELHDYQKKGILWIKKLHEQEESKRHGGILGDEMGMGKTRQTAVAMSVLINNENDMSPKRVLIICPPIVVEHWLREINHVLSDKNLPAGRKVTVVCYANMSNVSPSERKKRLISAKERVKEGELLIVVCSSTLVVPATTNQKQIQKHHYKMLGPVIPRPEEPAYDWIVVDEAHKEIPTKKTKLNTVFKKTGLLEGSFRLFLTGTPIQNGYHELCELLGFLAPNPTDKSKPFETFWKQHKQAILRGQDASANEFHKTVAMGHVEKLRVMVEPYVLQRLKKNEPAFAAKEKHEYAVWLKPTPSQNEASKSIITQYQMHLAGSTKTTAEVNAMNVLVRLRMIACCPDFANKVKEVRKEWFPDEGDDEEPEAEETGVDDGDAKAEAHQIIALPDDCGDGETMAEDTLDRIAKSSPQLSFCVDLVTALLKKGQKIVVFCSFIDPLRIIGSLVKRKETDVYQVLGEMTVNQKSRRIQMFNEPESKIKVMLASIQAVGLGVSLHGADSVILIGPHWNPAIDAQAVGRVHREGQTKPVKVYRLLMSETIDEKIYGIQLAKIAFSIDILKQMATLANRRFTDAELKKLITMEKDTDVAKKFADKRVDDENLRHVVMSDELYRDQRVKAVHHHDDDFNV